MSQAIIQTIRTHIKATKTNSNRDQALLTTIHKLVDDKFPGTDDVIAHLLTMSVDFDKTRLIELTTRLASVHRDDDLKWGIEALYENLVDTAYGESTESRPKYEFQESFYTKKTHAKIVENLCQAFKSFKEKDGDMTEDCLNSYTNSFCTSINDALFSGYENKDDEDTFFDLYVDGSWSQDVYDCVSSFVIDLAHNHFAIRNSDGTLW